MSTIIYFMTATQNNGYCYNCIRRRFCVSVKSFQNILGNKLSFQIKTTELVLDLAISQTSGKIILISLLLTAFKQILCCQGRKE